MTDIIVELPFRYRLVVAWDSRLLLVMLPSRGGMIGGCLWYGNGSTTTKLCKPALRVGVGKTPRRGPVDRPWTGPGCERSTAPPGSPLC